jgi:hypothetical protein
MKSYLKLERLVPLVNTVGIPLITLYLVSMIIAPWFANKSNWQYVQDVWDRWQTLNTGMLAFIASVIALNISTYHENKQRQRRFVAAKAFLPNALSELTVYFKGAAPFLLEAWEYLEGTPDSPLKPLITALPDAPGDYKEIFRNCISEAEDDVAALMASILTKLQILNARIREVDSSIKPDGKLIVMSGNIKVYLYNLAELQALINSLFGFARSMEDFSGAKLVWDDFKNAYANLEISIDQVDGLEDFTKWRLEKNSNSYIGV